MDTSKVDPEISPWTIVDITSEHYRTYTYADGRRFRIDNPKTLYILANGGHRVVDKAGVTHRPERGYVGISWMPKDGEPPFVA
jgi:hypothetical protein